MFAKTWRTFVCISLIALGCVSVLSAQEINLSPIGVVNLETVFESFPERSRPFQGFIADQAEYERDLQAEHDELDDAILKLLDAKLKNDDDGISRYEEEVEARKENYIALSGFYEQKRRVGRSALEQDAFYKEFARAVEYVAIDNKFTVIAQKGFVQSLFSNENGLYLAEKTLFVYSASQIDVTAKVIDRIRTGEN